MISKREEYDTLTCDNTQYLLITLKFIKLQTLNMDIFLHIPDSIKDSLTCFT